MKSLPSLENRISARVVFPNGYEVSIQHSEFHYCGPSTVEVAILKDDKFIEGYPGESHGVAGHVNILQLIAILNWAGEQS